MTRFDKEVIFLPLRFFVSLDLVCHRGFRISFRDFEFMDDQESTFFMVP